ncbi:MAG: TonB-dependent receptor [Acidobacteria bacterium]|nr:TonB-dependent receptor [Acidobacteriota bacterium]
MRRQWVLIGSIVFFVCLAAARNTFGQASGTVRGKITLADQGIPVHGVDVRIVELGETAESDEDGMYQLEAVPPGTYHLVAHMDGFRDAAAKVVVGASSTVTTDFQMSLVGMREQITVTASGQEEVAFQSFKVTTTLDSVQLAENAHTNIGEVLESQPGVAKRSFGPGTTRPVIRGFDGDRVLIVQDGARTGSLSSQSGDHGETIDPLSLERLEVVKGPSTLLYGSNALGGVVNAITGHDHAHPGARGYLTGVGGSNNMHGGGNGGFEFGRGSWLVWASGGGQRTDDYNTPIGEILNSESRVAGTSAGFGWFGNRGYLSLSYGLEDARYGIPLGTELPEEPQAGEEGEEVVDLSLRRHNLPLRFGFQNLESALDAIRVSLNYSKYHHEELVQEQASERVGTAFDNKQFVYRTTFDQKRAGILSGSFGFEGFHRDYKTAGEEAIAPPVKLNMISLFALEELGSAGGVRFQFGGRFEQNRYDPQELRSRTFNGFSGSAGIQIPLWEGGNFLLSYSHSDRSPALEELYNNGPHPGNLTFEIGNPDLKMERGNGIELSLRESASRVRGEANLFYYHIGNFVYLAPTGEEEDGLVVADYSQADSRFLGGEFGLDLGVHPNFWVNLGLDAVSAKLIDSSTPLPRIPPLRGRIGFEALYKGFQFKPELILANAQDDIFATETRTSGYAVWNFHASYTAARQHLLHIFSVNAFNLGNRLYRNHLSFIKEIAPEIGRGVRFSYTMRFF